MQAGPQPLGPPSVTWKIGGIFRKWTNSSLHPLSVSWDFPFLFLLLWLHKDKKGRRNMNNTHLALSSIILAVHLAGVTDGAGLHVYAAFYLPLYQQREESEASLN